jgi:hypothetical protein
LISKSENGLKFLQNLPVTPQWLCYDRGNI